MTEKKLEHQVYKVFLEKALDTESATSSS